MLNDVCGCRLVLAVLAAGAALATARGTLAAAVRARAPGVVSPRAISAYRASAEGGQYEKAAARGGTALRLAGVFADGGRARATRYAQLLDPHGHELFAPLSTRAELYEACGAELGVGAGARSAAHRLPHLIALAPPPCRARLLAGPVPLEMQEDVGDDLLLRSVITEPVLVVCSLPEGSGRESLRLLPLSGSVRARRSQLGYESERRMFLCSRLQRALAHCQLHADASIRAISYADDQDKPRQHLEPIKFEKERKFTLQGLKIDTSRLFGKSDKVLKDIPDENEGSIIFLSKNELEHMNYEVCSDEEATKCETKNEVENRSEKQFADDKMQVFREDCSHPKRNKWFKHLRLLKSSEKLVEEKITALENTENKDPFDPLAEKVSSIERYQDMAKLIEDRFGASRKSDAVLDHCHSYKSLTTNSDLGASTAPPSSSGKKPVLTKSVSVQTGITDSQFSQDPEPNLKHTRKNLSVDQINYCGSMESNTSSGRKLKSLDENMLKKSSATKSASNLEKRQRIQPDLIPEKGMIKSESFNQIQSCEDINMFGVGSMYNDSDFEINYKQHSFITEKLCSEFHVKTKRVLSKSTSNLLHAKKATDVKKEGENNSNSMPTKTERALSMSPEKFDKANFRKRQEKSKETFTAINVEEDERVQIAESPDAETNKNQVKLKRSISAIQKRKLPVIEDLPYGQVADAVRIAEEKIDSDTNSDNIYAEICAPRASATHEFEEEHYDFNNDVLANDPVISNVKKEVISRNGERIKQIAEHQSENAFRHIEVVVIEKSSELQTDSRSMNSSEFEEDSRGSINGTSQDSWERDRKLISNLDSKVHAIRLEITGNDFPEQKLISSIVDRNEEINISSKDVSLSFSNSVQFNGQYINSESEAVYDTLK